MSLRVKLLARGRMLTPYVSSVQTNGRVQRAFANQIGHAVGDCMRRMVHAGMPAAAIKRAARDCSRPMVGQILLDQDTGQPIRGRMPARERPPREILDFPERPAPTAPARQRRPRQRSQG